MTPNRPRPSVIIPHTPPSMYSTTTYCSTPPLSTSSSSSSQTSYFSPGQSGTCTPRGEREIMMGGLVSRGGSPRSEGEMEWDEKRQGSIEVPGIVLSESWSYRTRRTRIDPQPNLFQTSHHALLPLLQNTFFFYLPAPSPSPIQTRKPRVHRFQHLDHSLPHSWPS